MIEPRDLYENHWEATRQFLGEELPFWEELSWAERDSWQAQADELNEARLEPVEQAVEDE